MNTQLNGGGSEPQAGHPWAAYRGKLIGELRFRGVSAAVIGETIADMDAHLNDSGESPEEAYGTPEEYASEIAEATTPPTSRRDGSKRFLWLALPALGGAILGISGVRLGSGEELFFGIPAIVGFIAGLMLIIGIIGVALTRANIRDPRTDRIIGLTRAQELRIAVGILTVVIASTVVLGWITG